MGVKLSGIINKRAIDFSDLKGKKIAIDFSNMAYQFLSSIRSKDGTPLMDSKGHVTSVYVGIFSRISNLLSQNILPCFVFDGKPPALKIHVQEQREHRKRMAEERFLEAQEEEDITSMEKYAKQTSRLSKEIIEDSKELLKSLGLPVIQSPSEADAQISYICKKKDVWAVATSDADPLLYGCPRTITNLTLSQRRKSPSGQTIKITPELIELDEVLKSLKINQDQLIVLAIMCGTDYAPQGIKGIGPKKALKLVHSVKDFDKLFQELKPDFNWKQIYAIFKSMPIMENYQLKWTSPDIEKVKKILVDKHDFSEDRVNKTLQQITKKPVSQKGLDAWTK
ncbi:MAG: flap endonuclease-1 [Nanoarchaeota archaeon]